MSWCHLLMATVCNMMMPTIRLPLFEVVAGDSAQRTDFRAALRRRDVMLI